MTLASQLLHQIADPTITHSERTQFRCQLAKELEEAGNYEGAREALGEMWTRVGERPILDGLSRVVAADVLLRAGALTGWLGSAKQIAGAQEEAKNLISEGISIFEELRDTVKIAEAQTDLAICYWREGAFNEARVILHEALSRATDNDEVKAVALLRSAVVERASGRHNEAFNILAGAIPLIEASKSDVIKGKFHNQYAVVLMLLSTTVHRSDYRDRALIEYAAASFYFEQAGHRRYQACVENNLGLLFSDIGKFSEAHEHLDRAQALFTSLKDNSHLAGIDETRARVFLKEGRFTDAEKLARAAVQTLDKGGEQSLLAEALRTWGVALARSGRSGQATLTLRRAARVAEEAGDLDGAGQAALTLVEELGERLGQLELVETFERADELLAKSRHPGHQERLLTCARRVLFALGGRSGPEAWRGFSFEEAVRRFESRIIERALRDAGGVIALAARMLGLKRQSLSSMLHTRHRDLLPMRAPTGPRRRSLMFRGENAAGARAVTILHAEDRREISDAVKEVLESEGWRVEVVASGADALRRLRGEAHYDVLIFDYELPGLNGVELTREARLLPHRQRTPIIMLTAGEVEREARRAGVNSFLRKPQDVGSIAETVARLLARRQKRTEERDACDG